MTELEATLERPPVLVKAASRAIVNRCGGRTCPPGTCGHQDDPGAPTLFRSERHGSVATEPAAAREVTRSPGRPLPMGVRRTMGARFGRDFASVRVHDDAVAARSAATLDAHAYSVGDHIVFGANQNRPSSASGRRLLAHELTHVVQASAGGGVGKSVSAPTDASEREATEIAARLDEEPESAVRVEAVGSAAIHRQSRAGDAPPTGTGRAPVPAEKWSLSLEARYRANGDHQRAAAIRECRTYGGRACDIVLTQSEMRALYALSQEARGDRERIGTDITRLVPTLALLGPLPGSVGTGAGASAGAGAAAGAGAGTAAGVSAGAVTATGVGALVLVCVLAGYSLWKLGKFQQELTDRGFIILDDPLAVCISGCHHGTPSRLPDVNRFPSEMFPPVDLGEMRRYLERSPTQEPRTKDRPEPRPAPRPLPGDPDVEEDRRYGCRGFATFQRGGNSCHDRFATSVSGVPREWMVVTPEGLSDSFDARGQDRRTLYEMKTGYGWLSNENLSPAQQRFRASTAERWARQGAHQFAVAERCGYDQVWVFTSEAARRFADAIVPAPTRTVRFNCDDDGER